jgi:DNA-damage-inducible protein J
MKTLQIRLPEGLRDQADSVLAEMGLDTPTAVRLYLTKIVQTRSIPFSIEAPAVRVEPIEVDPKTQSEMDGIARAWKKHRS